MTSGPLTLEDLQALWRDVTDPSYWQPLAASEDGAVPIEQAMQQFVRLSQSVDRTTQSLFIFPWSGQTDEPASGARKAQVQLQIVRTKAQQHPLVLDAGLTVLHVSTDIGAEGGQQFASGRRYLLRERALLLPGVSSLGSVVATAEQAGTGYNLPQPGTIRQILQVGSLLQNNGAIVLPGNRLQLAAGSGDVLAPAHVLAYIQFTDGPNNGQVRRIIGYTGGNPAVLALDSEWILGGSLVGIWVPGELVTQAATGATARVVGGDSTWLVLESAIGTFTTAGAIVGNRSGATYTPAVIDQPGTLTEGAAAWRILDWSSDLGVEVTNLDFPSGGRLPILDELGDERNIKRAPGEQDVSYRPRVGNPADVVAPNAIRRTANHMLAPYSVACTYRQVGSRRLPGLFYGVPPTPGKPQRAFAYGLPMTGVHRFKRLLDLIHFRGYFLLGIPPINLGEFGCAYGAGPRNAYGAKVARGNFYGGRPIGTIKLHMAIRAAVERARMAGVRWDLYVERFGGA